MGSQMYFVSRSSWKKAQRSGISCQLPLRDRREILVNSITRAVRPQVDLGNGERSGSLGFIHLPGGESFIDFPVKYIYDESKEPRHLLSTFQLYVMLEFDKNTPGI